MKGKTKKVNQKKILSLSIIWMLQNIINPAIKATKKQYSLYPENMVKNETILQKKQVIKPGQMVLLYEKSPEEVWENENRYKEEVV